MNADTNSSLEEWHEIMIKLTRSHLDKEREGTRKGKRKYVPKEQREEATAHTPETKEGEERCQGEERKRDGSRKGRVKERRVVRDPRKQR